MHAKCQRHLPGAVVVDVSTGHCVCPRPRQVSSSDHNCVSRSQTATDINEATTANHAHRKAFTVRDCRKGSNFGSEIIRALCLTSDSHCWKAGRLAARAMLLRVRTTRSGTTRIVRSVHPHRSLLRNTVRTASAAMSAHPQRWTSPDPVMADPQQADVREARRPRQARPQPTRPLPRPQAPCLPRAIPLGMPSSRQLQRIQLADVYRAPIVSCASEQFF